VACKIVSGGGYEARRYSDLSCPSSPSSHSSSLCA
jgi:hypothetical protein